MASVSPMKARRISTVAELLLLSALFGLAYSQAPLYYISQNQYFFYGLMKSGVGFLSHDWVSRTPDPWPMFTLLVEFTHRVLGSRAFYMYFALMLGVYLYSLIGIASMVFGLGSSRARYLAFLATVVAVHSPTFGALSARLVGLNIGRALIEGVASQRILWDMFQPGIFGALLLLSVYLFLRGRPLVSACAIAAAVVFNPSYLLSAGILTLAYMVAIVRGGGGVKRAVALGAWTLALVLPVIAYMYSMFHPTQPDLWAQAQQILVHFRLSRHAVPAAWLSLDVVIQVGVLLAALVLIRRTVLFEIMGFAATMVVALTLAQVASGNDTLALLYPWRLSVLLIPLSTALVLAAATTAALRTIERTQPASMRAVVAVSIAALIGLAGVGVATTRQRFAARAAAEIQVMNAVERTKRPRDIYLTPLVVNAADPLRYGESLPNWQYFRLRTGAPMFVDYWFVPYDDVGVIEWYTRVRVTDAFYTGSHDVRCTMTKQLREYGVTHAILKSNDPETCDTWTLLARDRHYNVYRLAP